MGDSLEELGWFDGVDEALKEAGCLHLAVEHVGQVGAHRTREGGQWLCPLLPTHPAAAAGVLYKRHILSPRVCNKLLLQFLFYLSE